MRDRLYTYQNIEIPGREFTYIDPKRKGSKFWGEGKWNHFIKPLLPKEKGTFIEIGCSEGMFLKLAADEGFTKVIGIEPNKRRMANARHYRQSNGYSYNLIEKMVDENFDFDSLPLADVVLFSNVHYYFPLDAFIKIIDKLQSRARYCVVVSAVSKVRHRCAVYYQNDTRGYFRDWREKRIIEGADEQNDPAPRKGVYSILYEGKLDVYDIKKECAKWYDSKSPTYPKFATARALTEFNKLVVSKNTFDPTKTDLYRCWEKRKEEAVDPKYVRSLTRDIMSNGIKEPILINPRGRLIDGMHRISAIYALWDKYKLAGLEHILARYFKQR